MSHPPRPPVTHRRRVRAGALVAVLGAALSGDAGAGSLYRWTDADGNVQYSDRPPPDDTKQYEGPERPDGEALELESRIERDRAAREREAARAAAAREAELAASAPKDKVHSRDSCEEARRFAEHYGKSGQDFFTRGAGGGFVRSTPEQIAATEAEWRAAADVLCQDDVEIVRSKPQ